MIAQEVLRRQRELEPKEDLAPYNGQWVLLRYGIVCGHAGNLSELNIQDGDAVMKVVIPTRPVFQI